MKLLITIIRFISILSLTFIVASCGGAEDRKVKYLEKGKNYLNEKNFEKAKIEFKNVIQIDPKYADAFYYMGQVEEKQNELAKAVANYKKTIELSPDHDNAKIRLARIYSIVGTDSFVSEAEKLIAQVKVNDPESIQAMLIEAAIDIKRKNTESAITKLKLIIDKDNKQSEAYSFLSAIQSSQKNYDEAIDVLQEGIKHNPEAVSLRMALVQLLIVDNRDLEGAEQQLKQLISIDPESFNYRVALATFYVTSNRVDQAEATLRQAVADNEDDVNRYLVLVEMLAAKRGAKAAESELLSAINKKPEFYELRFALAKFYSELSLYDKAIDVLQGVINDKGTSSEGLKARVTLGEIYINRNDVIMAQKLLEEVLAENPTDINGLYLNARLAFMKLDDQTAINALRTVLKNDPKNNDAALLLAQAHERSGDTELANDVLLKTLEIDPLNSKNHINYANYLASKNNKVKALSTVDRAIDYFKTDYDLYTTKLGLLVPEKDDDEILNVLNKMKSMFGNKEDVYMTRGQYFVSKKQIDKALNEFKDALSVSKTVYKPLESVVKAYVSLKQEDEAFKLLDDRLSKNPDDVIANQVLGQLYLSKDKNKSLQYFKKAMSLGKWEVPYLSVASVHISNGDPASAVSVLEQGVSNGVNPTSLLMQIAGIHERTQKFDDAISVYEKIIQVNPANHIAANNLASLIADYRTDEESLKKALSLSKSFAKTRQPAFIDTLGWVYLKNNDLTNSVATLEEAVKLAPNVSIFQYHLGIAYHQSGDKIQAKRYLTSAVESDQEFPGKDKAKEILATL